MTAEPRFVYDAANAVDPLGDAEKEADKGTKHNRAKVGSGRPSSLLYTYGPGAIMVSSPGFRGDWISWFPGLR